MCLQLITPAIIQQYSSIGIWYILSTQTSPTLLAYRNRRQPEPTESHHQHQHQHKHHQPTTQMILPASRRPNHRPPVNMSNCQILLLLLLLLLLL